MAVDIVRECIIEMQISLSAVEKTLSRWLSMAEQVVRDEIQLEFSTRFVLPDLPGKRPLKSPYLNPEEMTGWDVRTQPSGRSKRVGYATAQDLFEAAELDSDPLRAARLLKRTLGYDLEAAGVDRGDVYHELGQLYEQAGNDKKALQYYTKAVEARSVIARYSLLYRGEAHFRLGLFAKAQADLEQAIRLGLENTLQQEAESYLTRIRATSY